MIWKNKYISYNQSGKASTFVAVCNGKPVGEGTLLFSPQCSAVNKRTQLTNHNNITNINALRICKEYDGKGHISSLIEYMENYAVKKGYRCRGTRSKKSSNLFAPGI